MNIRKAETVDIRKEIKLDRVKMGLTQGEASKKIGCSQAFLSMAEKGRLNSFSSKKAKALLNFFNYEIKEVIVRKK